MSSLMATEKTTAPIVKTWSMGATYSRGCAVYEPIPGSLNLSAFEEPICYAFLLDDSVWASYATPWLQLCAEGKLGALSQQACRALSQASFGHHYAQSESELAGVVAYGRTLTAVRGLISQPNEHQCHLLAPILLMLMQATVRSSRTECESHIRGMMALLMECGPQAFQHGYFTSIFSSCRSTLITVAMISRRRTFLADHNWCSIPWAGACSAKSHQDELVDILAAVPGFLEEVASLEHVARDDCRWQTARLQIHNSLSQLFQWRRNWDTAYPGVAREVDRIALSSNSFTNLPDEARRFLCYTSFARSVEHSLYNAVLICLIGLLHAVLPPSCAWSSVRGASSHTTYNTILACESATGPTILSPDSFFDLRDISIEITRAFEYQLLHMWHRESALYWLFPLGLASQILGDEPSWLEWIGRLRAASQQSRGYGRKAGAASGFAFFPLPSEAKARRVRST
jgi:hypothetical protein